MTHDRLAVEPLREPTAEKSDSADLYEQVLQAAIRHLKACCSNTAFNDAQVREFLTRRPQEDGSLYTEVEYEFMCVDDHERPSNVAPIWRIDATHIKEPLVLKGLSFYCSADTLDRIRAMLDRMFCVRFINCDFYIESLSLGRCATHFEQCRFHHNRWTVTSNNYAVFDELYLACEFGGTVIMASPCAELDFVTDFSVFTRCQLHSLEIESITLRAKLFNSAGDCGQVLKRLTMRGVTLEKAVALDHAQIGQLCLQDSRMRKPLKLSYAQIQEATFEDTVFVGAIAMNHSQVGSLLMQRCDCRHVVDMDNSVLGQSIAGSGVLQREAIRFPFTTFHQDVSFRDSHWHVPLDIQNTSRQQSLDFKGFRLEKVARQGTDRETFRIIRHSFDSVGNHVDAGRCYALEMEAYRREMQGSGQLAERFLLWCNSWMSYHGQSYLRPIGWILLGLLAFTLLRHAHQASWLYRLYPPANDELAMLTAGFNALAQSLIIFTPLMVDGMEMLSLLFGLLFSTLTWQAVIAMRRHTRK